MAEVPTNPGSYNEFVKEQGLEMNIGALMLYSEAMTSYRANLTEARGVTLEDLHTMPWANFVQLELPEAI